MNPGEEYQVTFEESTLPANHQFTTTDAGTDETADSDADASGVTPIVTLTSGENNPDIDAGILEPASLGDTVFLDNDGDGIQNSGESGVSGITVTLVGGGADGLIDDNTSTTGVDESADNTTVTTSTDSSGTYSFTGLNPGEEYQVTFEESSLPTGAEFTDTNAGTDTTADSDADASGVTPIVTLTSGENNPDIDAGILQTASLGDTVFLDNDGDGIQDSGESGVSGITVTLVGGGADGLIDDNTSTTGVDESADNTTVTTSTDSSGTYSFTGLNPGEEYQVTFEESTLPANHQFIQANVGSDETADSDADASGVTPIVTLTSGENNPDIDAGILAPASLGDKVFLDNDGDGIQNSGESGVSGITVTLVGGGADGLIDDNTSTTGVDESADNTTVTTSTDSSGTYSFTGLNPGEEYQVTFEESTLPTGAEFTDTNAGTDTTADSDADASGVTPIVTLTSGENNPDIDAGILQTASLGDTVFLDNDGDGIQDSGESGVSGITVTLVGGGADGLIDDNTSTTGVDESADNTTVTTSTDSSGTYSFTGLNPGEEYQVTFEESTLPANHQFIQANVGSDETADSDADASG